MSYGGDRTADECPGCGVIGHTAPHNTHSEILQCDNSGCSVHQFWSLTEEEAA